MHDFNPGNTQHGVFWTTVLGDDAVTVDFAAGTATMTAHDLVLKDYHDFRNAILRDGVTPRSGRVSFTVQWTAAAGAGSPVSNPDQQYRADVKDASVQMEWSGRTGDWEFQSEPLAKSMSEGGELAMESNGSFF